MKTWLVIVWLLFPGERGPQILSHPCPSLKCIVEAVQIAKDDDDVYRYQVLPQGVEEFDSSHYTVAPPIIDVWKL